MVGKFCPTNVQHDKKWEDHAKKNVLKNSWNPQEVLSIGVSEGVNNILAEARAGGCPPRGRIYSEESTEGHRSKEEK